jgi:hypothetical protein
MVTLGELVAPVTVVAEAALYKIMRVVHWSLWRRRSQKRAQVSHYAARGFLDP